MVDGIGGGGITGSDLKDSQAGGGSGLSAGNRDQQQSAQGGTGGQQQGGGAGPSDMRQDGGSSGTGGYGKAQNQAFHQGEDGAEGRSPTPADTGDRGADYDAAQGGGRDSDSVGR